MIRTKIIHNRARCARCGDIVESMHRHDWVRCSCGAIFVDGGHAYLRGGGNADDFIGMYEVEEYDDELL